MYDTIFSKSFNFNIFNFKKYKYTDNRHGVSAHFFAYMISGHCRISTGDKTVSIKEGDIFYIPNGCKYQSYWYGEPEIKFISLGFRFLPNFEKKNYSVQVLPYNEEAVKLFYGLFENKVLESRDVGVFYTLVGMLLPAMTGQMFCRTKELVELTKRYLTEHPFAEVSELAKNCAVSESALYSAFQKSSDVTLNALRNQIIIEKAKMLLITTNMSVEEISRQLRFSSCSYFRKVFKKYLNATPSEIRKRNRI
ncbi:MAG: helix-turn-helix domain-containing protein [Clostridia bacterium]|nr:helix-turn-helix domain-containing protein [Clostridia bacterium]